MLDVPKSRLNIPFSLIHQSLAFVSLQKIQHISLILFIGQILMVYTCLCVLLRCHSQMSAAVSRFSFSDRPGTRNSCHCNILCLPKLLPVSSQNSVLLLLSSVVISKCPLCPDILRIPQWLTMIDSGIEKGQEERLPSNEK